jgi:hypothetical protein
MIRIEKENVISAGLKRIGHKQVSIRRDIRASCHKDSKISQRCSFALSPKADLASVD